MKKFKPIAILCLVLTASCVTSRVIKQTDSEAIIQGLGVTKIEARMSAEEKAKSIFPTYALKKEPECSQEYSVEASEGKAQGDTYWSCVVEVQKK